MILIQTREDWADDSGDELLPILKWPCGPDIEASIAHRPQP